MAVYDIIKSSYLGTSTACLLIKHLHSVNKVNFGLKIAELKKIKSVLSLITYK